MKNFKTPCDLYRSIPEPAIQPYDTDVRSRDYQIFSDSSLLDWVPRENATWLAYFPLGFFQREELKDLLFLMRDRLLVPVDFIGSGNNVLYLSFF